MTHVYDKFVGTVGGTGVVLGMPDGALVIINGVGGNLTTALLAVVGDNAPVALVNEQSKLLGGLHTVCQSLAGSVGRQGTALAHIYKLVILLCKGSLSYGAVLVCFLIMYGSALCGCA